MADQTKCCGNCRHWLYGSGDPGLVRILVTDCSVHKEVRNRNDVCEQHEDVPPVSQKPECAFEECMDVIPTTHDS